MTIQTKLPSSVAEMLAVLADRLAVEAPKTDAEIAALCAEDDDAKWDDRDPAYLDEDRIIARVDAADDRCSDRRDRPLKLGCRRI